MPDSPILDELRALLRTPQPAGLGPELRAGVQDSDSLARTLAPLLANCSPDNAALIRSLVLLWHDHLDASHNISQVIETPDGSFLHGIMHRREPDYWNSKYWFRRVGNHAAFPEIAKHVSKLFERHRAAAPASWVTCDPWDPFAFVDAVEAASSRAGTEGHRAFLRDAQQVEFEVLLAHFAARS